MDLEKFHRRMTNILNVFKRRQTSSDCYLMANEMAVECEKSKGKTDELSIELRYTAKYILQKIRTIDGITQHHLTTEADYDRLSQAFTAVITRIEKTLEMIKTKLIQEKGVVVGAAATEAAAAEAAATPAPAPAPAPAEAEAAEAISIQPMSHGTLQAPYKSPVRGEFSPRGNIQIRSGGKKQKSKRRKSKRRKSKKSKRRKSRRRK